MYMHEKNGAFVVQDSHVAFCLCSHLCSSPEPILHIHRFCELSPFFAVMHVHQKHVALFVIQPACVLSLRFICNHLAEKRDRFPKPPAVVIVHIQENLLLVRCSGQLHLPVFYL